VDAVGSERAALLGFSEGAALSVLFAASNPERTRGLVPYDSVVVGAFAGDPDPSWVKSSMIVRETIDRWGEGQLRRARARVARDRAAHGAVTPSGSGAGS
jgi:pimeloyl-ACP methyl ester carboxylesterase